MIQERRNVPNAGQFQYTQMKVGCYSLASETDDLNYPSTV